MLDIIPQKRCVTCKQFYPPTSEYFHQDKRKKDNLNISCKSCRAAIDKRSYDNLKSDTERHERRKDVRRDYLAVHTQTEEFKAKERERSKRRYAKDKVNPLWMEWKRQKGREAATRRRNNPLTANDVRSARNRWGNTEYGRKHLKQYMKDWYQTPNGKVSLAKHHETRRAQENAQVNTFTQIDYERMANYFHGCCAVCGRQLNDLLGEHKESLDHWIPLTKGGGLTALNVIPLCFGVNGCNNSKRNNDPLDWLMRKHGKRKAAEIHQRILEYFEWVHAQI